MMKAHKPQYDAIFNTDLAIIGLRFIGSSLTNIDYLTGYANTITTGRHAQGAQNKIEEYLESKIKNIKIDMILNVTQFQLKVLNQLQQIPYGETRTYGEIAKILKTSPRAVGNACRKNPLPIVIPCHRVVAANGIGGYSGATQGRVLEIKYQLLKLEGAI